MKRTIIFISFIALIAGACESRRKEAMLAKKQAELRQKEQELLLKEKTLEFRDEELGKKELALDSAIRSENLADSLARTDTGYAVNNAVIGPWSVKMTCIATTCPGSAVGDVKNEQWEIGYEGNHVVAKAMVGDRLARVYSGMANNNTLELLEHKDTTSRTADTRIVVRLNLKDPRTLEGTREIIRENDCRIVYAMRMEKQK